MRVVRKREEAQEGYQEETSDIQVTPMSHNGGNMVEDLVEFIKVLLLILSLPVSIDIMKDILE